MLPVVALVGRSNVGKSTFFNLLTRTRDALVADFPGLTRDRKYGYAEIAGRKFVCIDTAGINGAEYGIQMCTLEQSLLAIKEANIVLFIVDAHTGLMPADSNIAKHLRSCAKLTFLIVNKTDGIDANQAITDFYSLGFNKIFPISASHGRGMFSLLKTFLLPAIDKVNSLKKIDKNIYLKDNFSQRSLPIKLAIIGRPNVGKSTIVNRILNKQRMVVYDTPGTTRDSIHIPTQHNGRIYVLIDTAGVRKRSKKGDVIEKFSVIKTLQAIKNANTVLLVIDACEGISDQDLSLLSLILDSGRSLVIIINKWDSLSNDEARKHMKDVLSRRLSFINFVRLHFISALHGTGMNNLFDSVCEAYDNSTRYQSAAKLTCIMNMATKNHHPPLIRGGRRVKMKYAHVGGYNPLIVVIHGNQVKNLPNSYRKYLINYFRNSLEIIGAPIYIQFREGKNPFIHKHSILASTQVHNLRRSISHVKK